MKAFLLFFVFFSLAAKAAEEANTTDLDTQSLEDLRIGDQEKVINIHHPNAAKGLIRINSDGSYQYKVKIHEKTEAATISISSLSPPKISNPNGITFSSMYGTANVYGAIFNYEWMPFRKFGSFGVLLESGLSVTHGRGSFAGGQAAEESYSFFIVPLSVFLKYRLEYFKRQWVVPYVLGGGTYYGLAEVRDDGKPPQFAGSPAVGGGGGLQINISRYDIQAAFNLDREYGITDMWLTLEMRTMVGLRQDIDFTNTTISIGTTVDY